MINDICIFVGIALVCSIKYHYKNKSINKLDSSSNNNNNRSWNSKTVDNRKEQNESVFYPPLPKEVLDVLNVSRLCFLATQSHGEPHLSLMTFTYYEKEDTMIFTTRRNTKKFTQITDSPKVAVLIHDFPHLETGAKDQYHGKSFSITLNGNCEVCVEGSEMESVYREVHLLKNPDYAQFISGESNAVIIVRVESARMCDINDRVTYWCSKDGLVTAL